MGESNGYSQLCRLVKLCLFAAITCLALAAALAARQLLGPSPLRPEAFVVSEFWLGIITTITSAVAINGWLARARSYWLADAIDVGMIAGSNLAAAGRPPPRQGARSGDTATVVPLRRHDDIKQAG